ncbi:hypothetical protein QQ008_25480 [Fulvivirgaceae bacterium BMA10]|uniref:YbjQ family protein n=1 Tax=Splendidivirga corallicola TaxID=3051826 RepID=A0ABT8KXU2_9BACT|nr:hypothetical protein [Fulvivirgaceae bacterium BMA10]
MKITKILFFSSIILLSGCKIGLESISYLGEELPDQSGEVLTFYDENEIKKPYRILGSMVNELYANQSADDIKANMINKARLVGADALIFVDMSTVKDEDGFDCLAIKSKAIKFK